MNPTRQAYDTMKGLGILNVVDAHLNLNGHLSQYVDNSAVVVAFDMATYSRIQDVTRMQCGMAVLIHQVTNLLHVLRLLATAHIHPYADVFTVEGFAPLDYTRELLAILSRVGGGMDGDNGFVQDVRNSLLDLRQIEQDWMNAH